MFNAFFEGLVITVRQAVEQAQAFCVTVFLAPFREAAPPEEIAVILEQLLKAGAGDAGEFDFGFFGSGGGLAAFEDVLFAGPGGLDHLVDSAIAFVEETLAKADGAVIDNSSFLESKQLLIAAVGWYETLVFI